jgi:hypothetical protein
MGMDYSWLKNIVATGQSVLTYPGGGVTQMEIQYLLEHWYIQVGPWPFPAFQAQRGSCNVYNNK